MSPVLSASYIQWSDCFAGERKSLTLNWGLHGSQFLSRSIFRTLRWTLWVCQNNFHIAEIHTQLIYVRKLGKSLGLIRRGQSIRTPTMWIWVANGVCSSPCVRPHSTAESMHLMSWRWQQGPVRSGSCCSRIEAEGKWQLTMLTNFWLGYYSMLMCILKQYVSIFHIFPLLVWLRKP